MIAEPLPLSDDEKRLLNRTRQRRNRIVGALLLLFVAAVFALSFVHLRIEAGGL